MSDGRMRLIIAGSRTVTPSREQITEVVRALVMAEFGDSEHDELAPRIAEVISGKADGGDLAGEAWAKSYGIPVHSEPITEEDRKRWGPYVAPKMRNRRMAERGTHAALFWDGISGGTSDMCARMVARGKPVQIVPTAKRRRPKRWATAR
jgi:hypothetical protein